MKSRRTVREAREFYVAEMVRYRAKHETPYMTQLQFEPQADSSDSDVSLVTADELRSRAERLKAPISRHERETLRVQGR